MKFPPSPLALKMLSPLERGIEIGAAAHNSFELANSTFVDFMLHTDSAPRGSAKAREPGIQPVDLLAQGDRLPFADCTWDYVLSSHVLEHLFDPIAALTEWMRVIRPGGIIFMIIPHHERTFDNVRQRTLLIELVDRHEGRIFPEEVVAPHGHCSVWSTLDVLELCCHLGFHLEHFQDVDDKVGNGFTVVLRKRPNGTSTSPKSRLAAAPWLLAVFGRLKIRKLSNSFQRQPAKVAWHIDQCWVDMGGTYFLGWIHAFDQKIQRLDLSIGSTTVTCTSFHRRDDVATSYAAHDNARDCGFEIFISSLGPICRLGVQTDAGDATLELVVAQLATQSRATIDSRLFRRIPLSGPPVRLFYNIENFWVDQRGFLFEGWLHCCEQPVRSLVVEVGDQTVKCETLSHREDIAALFEHYPPAVNSAFSTYLDCRPGIPVILDIETDLGHHRFQVVFPVDDQASNDAKRPPPDCFSRFLSMFTSAPGLVIELGSRHVSPGHHDIRASIPANGRYVGVDIHPGPGVDLIADAHFLSKAIPAGSADYLISLSVLEHLAFPWIAAREINRVLRIGGQLFIDVPWTMPGHELPNDYWRFSDEGLKVLFGEATGFEVIEANQHSEFRVYPHHRQPFTQQMRRIPSYGGSYIHARKISEIPAGAIAWPTDALTSRQRALRYPSHTSS
jgi:predicted SAM-dependent methyltransferase